MKKIRRYLALTLTLLILAACGGGGGGGGGSTQSPSASTYTLTFASGGNGTLTGTASQMIAQAGNASAVTAVPSAGYHFVNWTEDGSAVGVNASLSVTNVSANHSYTANFAIDTQAKTAATLTINLTGSLPVSTAISGAAFTLTLPVNVTPAMVNGAIATGVVSVSGTFAGSTLSPQVVYTAATSSAGTLNITLANSIQAGVTQVGEVATITLQLANGAAPTAGSFGLSAVSVIDATLYAPITGMNAVIAGVTLQ
jgi:uncharacterized repeat protein (TIGR02543 family)